MPAKLIILAALLFVGCTSSSETLRAQASRNSEIKICELAGGLVATVPYCITLQGSGRVILENKWYQAMPQRRERRITWHEFLSFVDRLDAMNFFDIDETIETCASITDANRHSVFVKIGARSREVEFDTSCDSSEAQALREFHQYALEALSVGMWEPTIQRFIPRPN